MIKNLNMVIEKRKINWHGIFSCWVPVIAYMALIFYISNQSLEEFELPDIWSIDKLIHAIEYAVLGFLCVRTLKMSFVSPSLPYLAFILTFAYGISDEVHQMFVFNRTSSIFDVLADGVGALAGVWLYKGRVK